MKRPELISLWKHLNGFVAIQIMVAALAAVTNLLWPGTVWGLLVCVGALLLAVVPTVRQVRERAGQGEAPVAMGDAWAARLLLLVASLASDVTILNAIACLLVAVSIVLEQSMTHPVASALPAGANIPKVRVREPSVLRGDLLYGANTFALIVSLTPWGVLTLVAGLAAIGLSLTVLYQVARYRRDRGRFERGLVAHLRKLQPTFVFHWQAPAGGAAYQPAMWLPYLSRIGQPFVVVVRTLANYRDVLGLTDAPIVLRKTVGDLDNVVVGSTRAVFYVNTATANAQMIRYPHLTHIQLNHGDSDKISSVSPTFRQYDRNFVAGQAAIDRFRNAGVVVWDEQFVIVGRPQLENVRRAATSVTAVELPTVLYSPTWSGLYGDSDYSSLRAGPAIVAALVHRGYRVVFRPHPYARRSEINAAACDQIIAMLSEDAAVRNIDHVFGARAETEMSIFDCFNTSDAMISDVSSILSDYLASGKPFAVVSVGADEQAFRSEAPLSKAGHVLVLKDGRPQDFEELLADMLEADPYATLREQLRTYYLSDADPDDVAGPFLREARKFLTPTGVPGPGQD